MIRADRSGRAALLAATLLGLTILAARANGQSPATTAAPPPAGSAAPAPASSALPAPHPAAEPPAPPQKPLSDRERKELRKKLPERYRVFLEEVDPLLFDLELDVFLRLSSDGLRDRFIDQFWRRRNSIPGGRNDFRATWYERLATVKERYGLDSDPGKVWMLQGEPDEIRTPGCPSVYVPMEIWLYERIPAWKRGATLVAYQPDGMGRWRIWTPTEPLSSLFQRGQSDSGKCPDGGYMVRLFRQMRSLSGLAFIDFQKLFAPPEVSLEGVSSLLAVSPDLPTDAAPLTLGRVFRFRRLVGSRMAVEISVLVPRDQLAARDVAGAPFAAVELVGEVVVPASESSEERLVDSFRYRFDLPIDPSTPAVVPVTAERLIRPGAYQLRLRATDANRNAAGRFDEPFVVPDRPEGEEEKAREEVRADLSALAAAGPKAVEEDDPVALAPIAGDALVGLQKIEAIVRPGVAAVEFWLDDRKVGTRRAPPFELDVHLGDLPRPRTIRVVARDKAGLSLGADETVVNESRDTLRVRIARPSKGEKSAGPTRVEAVAIVPDGRKLAKMDFLIDDRPVATLFGPPWVQILEVRDSSQPSTLRVVATLDDETTAEDLRFLNAPEYLEEVEVERIELYVGVVDGGRLVTDLGRDDFTISVDGRPVPLEDFEVVKNLPLHVVLAVDTSESMRTALPEATAAAAGFVSKVLTPKDRAALLRFDDEPMMVQRFTPDLERLRSALAGLSADRGTALWDATIYSLYQFQGKRGRKSLVLLTDGRDTDSRFGFDEALEFAHRSGATIHAIGLAISRRELDVRSKLLRLADETGGRAFFIDSASELTSIYSAIDAELRTRYRLTFAPPGKKDGKWHTVTVETPKRGGDEVKAASGYYR